MNDVSVRDWQFRSATLMLGKGWDTHGPIGPWLVTTDEIPDPQTLRIRTWVSGELLQDGTTADMVYGVAEQLSVLTTAMTLEPGTVLATGTRPASAWPASRHAGSYPATSSASRSTASAPSRTLCVAGSIAVDP